MRLARNLVVLAAAATQAASGQATTAPAAEPAALIQTALSGGGTPYNDGGEQPAILARLVHVAMQTLRTDEGADAVTAARAELKPFLDALRTARQAHDTTALRAAHAALRQAEAEFVVEVLGTEPATRAIAHATTRLDALEEHIGMAGDAGRDTERLEALAASLRTRLDAASAAAAAGDHVTALLLATEILHGMHAVQARGPGGDRPGRGNQGR